MSKPTIFFMAFGVLVLLGGAGFGAYLTTREIATVPAITDSNSDTSSPSSLSRQDDEVVESAEFLTFIPDDGIRMDYASNPGAKMSDDSLLLLYEARSGQPGHRIAQALEDGDWLSFGAYTGAVDEHNFRAHKLPDGTWRAYGFDTTVGIDGTCLTSRSSTDGITFSEDAGCRYELHEDDNGRMGVYEFFNASNGDVVMLYLGDLMGLNNTRRAVSTDGGWTFTFDSGDVLGDADDGGGARSYVDEKVIGLEDGTFYLIAMQRGAIHAFVSTDDGATFTLQGEILSPSDFDPNAGSLHDPQIMRLPDGRYRIFVTLKYGKEETARQAIVSATTAE